MSAGSVWQATCFYDTIAHAIGDDADGATFALQTRRDVDDGGGPTDEVTRLFSSTPD